jgi:hypothetical protein
MVYVIQNEEGVIKTTPSPASHPYSTFSVLLLGKVCRVEHAVINIDITAIITSNGISTPEREWSGNTASTSHSKRQHEDTHLGSTIQRSGDEVVPFHEVLRFILSEIPLTKDSNDVVGQNGGIDADKQVAHIPQNYGAVEVAPDALLWEYSVHDVEGQWAKEADEERNCHPSVD